MSRLIFYIPFLTNDTCFGASLVRVGVFKGNMSSFVEFLLEILGNVLAWFPSWKYKGAWIVIMIICVILAIAAVSSILMW